MTKRSLCALGLLLGCGGTETGNPVEIPNESGGFGNCELVSSEKLELAAASELGFSADDVLAFAGGTHAETLTWQALRFGSYGPETGEGALTLGVAARTAKLVRYRNAGGLEIESNCGPQLEIESDVTLRSAGGALNEQLRAKLIAPRADLATLYVRFDPKKLDGTLVVTPPSGPGFGGGEWITASVVLDTKFTRYGLSGSLYPTFEQHTADSVGESASSGPVATFGLPACESGVPVPLTTTVPAATLALLAQHGTASFGGTNATLVFEPSSQVACEGDEWNGDVHHAIDGTLGVKTADGAIDGRWPVRVVAKDVGGQISAEVQLRDQVPGGDSLTERYGFTQLDASGYGSSSATADLKLGVGGWSGEVVAYGFTQPVCPQPKPDDTSSPGCHGADRTELMRWVVR